MKTLKIYSLTILMGFFGIISAKAQDAPLPATINKIVDSYIAVKNALINANGAAAATNAKDLLTALNNVPQKSMTTLQHALWARYEAKLQYDSRHISEVSLVAHQREHFANLSTNLFAVLKGFKLNQKDLYWENCVMKSKYYISESPTEKDPYMGMANCSKVKETLKGVK